VVIVGGGATACEVGEFLEAKGKRVTILEMQPVIGADIGPKNRWVIIDRMVQARIRMEAGATVTGITDKGVTIVRKGKYHEFFEADTVVIAVGMKAVDTLANALEGKVPELVRIGDCVQPGEFCEPTLGQCLPQPDPLLCEVVPAFATLAVTVEWSFGADEVISAPAVADLDGDGTPDVALNLTRQEGGSWPVGNVVVLDGRTGAEKLRVPHDPATMRYGSHGRSTLAVGDVSGEANAVGRRDQIEVQGEASEHGVPHRAADEVQFHVGQRRADFVQKRGKREGSGRRHVINFGRFFRTAGLRGAAGLFGRAALRDDLTADFCDPTTSIGGGRVVGHGNYQLQITNYSPGLYFSKSTTPMNGRLR